MNHIYTICVLCVLVVSSQMLPQKSSWPTIQTVEVTRSYDLSKSTVGDTPLRLILGDLRGTPAYRLECHNGDYDVDSEYTYSGDFHCALFALKASSRASWNLLATSNPAQQKSDWLNRGRMTASQLHGPCADVPDYGDTRRFYLRHMQLTLHFGDVRWRAQTQSREPKLAGFTVRVGASPDPRAQTATAAPASPPKEEVSASCGFPPGG